MPWKAKELTPLEVRRLARPGRWSVGGVDGLALQVTPSGARSWVLRLTIGGKQREMGLGSFPSVTLAQAKEFARSHRAKAAEGVDPISVRRASESAAEAERQSQQTFATVAEQYIEQHASSWRNPKHAAQWTATLRTYAEPVIGSLLVRDVATAHVLKVLEPIWASKTETASRVRGRIELVLDFAAARGLRTGPNPARWRGNLDAALPKPTKVTRLQHHAAIPFDDAPAFISRLRKVPGMGARALEFLVLTAARSGEIRGAAWSEIDLDNAIWIIPAARMKGGREHRVPLSKPAVELLKALPRSESSALLFPGLRGSLSDMSLTAVMRRMKVDGTVHGLRSTFRDWCSERTDFANEVAEMALAHAVGDKVEAAYRRGDLLDKRVQLMQRWAEFVTSPNRKAGTPEVARRRAKRAGVPGSITGQLLRGPASP